LESEKNKSITDPNDSKRRDDVFSGVDKSPEPSTAGPLYMGLLWDNELELMRPLLRVVVDNIERVMQNAHRLCTTHFGEPRGIFKFDAFSAFTRSMLEALTALVEDGPSRHRALLIAAGRMLAQRAVPFQDVILALPFYEESAFRMLPGLATNNVQICQLFDKLKHIRLASLAEGYFQTAARSIDRLIQAEPQQEAGGVAVRMADAFHGIVGASPPMRGLFERIKAAAAVRGTVLLVGESGTGKELVARAIHEHSHNSAGQFIAVNCAAIPKDLIESELFGYARGAFSGANAPFLGLFRSADGGTLFLDEVTEMSPGTQTKVLRAIQERAVRPLGSTSEIAVGLRLIASTNRDPDDAAKSGALRADLYYRLQANVLHLPPLRERVEDIPLLAAHFINLLGSRIGRREPVTGIEADALDAMRLYSWPGNVRELSNAIETAITFGKRPLIQIEDLPESIVKQRAEAIVSDFPTTSLPALPIPRPTQMERAVSLSDGERQLLNRALTITGGNKSRAARLLQISRKRLYFLVRKYGL